MALRGRRLPATGRASPRTYWCPGGRVMHPVGCACAGRCCGALRSADGAGPRWLRRSADDLDSLPSWRPVQAARRVKLGPPVARSKYWDANGDAASTRPTIGAVWPGPAQAGKALMGQMEGPSASSDLVGEPVGRSGSTSGATEPLTVRLNGLFNGTYELRRQLVYKRSSQRTTPTAICRSATRRAAG